MDYEFEIRFTSERISDIEYRIVEINQELKDMESAKRDAENDATLGLLQMSSSALKPIGTYNFLNGTGTVGDIRIKIKELQQEKKDLEWELWEEKNKLKSLKEDFEFSKRPQATLVTTKDKIYIEGDEKQSNVISWLEHDIKTYISEYNRILESEEVAEYKKLKADFEALVKKTDLPKATQENLDKLAAIKKEYGLDVKYIIMDGKLIVEDSVSHAIETSKSLAGYYAEDVEKTKKRYDDFKPTFFGKVFKSVGKKQKKAWDSKIAESEKYFTDSLEKQRDKVVVYEQAKAEFIAPAKDVLAALNKLNELIDNSYYVGKFINHIDTYKKNIENHTILKNTREYDTMNSIMSTLKRYLDEHNLKLSREDIYDAIFESEYHQELALEIYNATGYKPKKKKVVAPVSQPSNE